MVRCEMAEQVVNYQCPACQAPISFKPGVNKVVCEYCENEFDVETIKKIFANKEALAQKAHEQKEAKWQKEKDEEFSEEESEDLLEAALVFSAERLAMNYLARAEQCRAGLTRKLIAKGLDKKVIFPALDYLESVKYLDDYRFAGAWLRNRSIDHAEGRIKLSAELAARGVDKTAAVKALDEFFESTDELELCRRAYSRLLRIKTKPEK